MPIVTKRRCVGTTAKLTICVGMNTPLQTPLLSFLLPLTQRCYIGIARTYQLRMSVGTYA